MLAPFNSSHAKNGFYGAYRGISAGSWYSFASHRVRGRCPGPRRFRNHDSHVFSLLQSRHRWVERFMELPDEEREALSARTAMSIGMHWIMELYPVREAR